MTRKSFTVLAFTCLSAAVALALALHPSPADAQREAILLCPSTMPSDRTELECRCEQAGSGASVWGTDFYTDDSSLCPAAVHAGAIPASGGDIRVRTLPGRDYYTGSRRNGISTSDYGSWRRTIVFEGASSVTEGSRGVPACPGTYNASGTGWSGTCRCLDTDAGAVWGTGVYTADSNLCRAARHAGVVGAAGGLVQVTAAPGQSSYAGSTRNGVTTNDWGSYGDSFRVSAVN
jgi:hypothetical protein